LSLRYWAANRKVKLLTSLRATVALGPDADILPSQWAAIESPLAAAAARLSALLEGAGERYLSRLHDSRACQAFNAFLGKLEVALSRSLSFFDTFVDILSQRHLPEAGVLLRGCDVLAFDSLNQDHPALAALERPLVYLDRGFGASTLRQGVTLSGRERNPLQTIQVPYTKLCEKYNLTSVLHEAGHAALARLGLTTALPNAIGEALVREGAPRPLPHLFRLWSREIGPDFWVFCNCGAAEAWSARDILSLDPARVLNVSTSDPHPPPYLRVLLGFEWCRQQWGRGEWDDWADEWTALYPLDEATPRDRRILTEGARLLPVVARTLLRTGFTELNQKPIVSLFHLGAISPTRIDRRIREATATGILDLSGLSPCGQLAVFNAIRARGALSATALDRLMTRWLRLLAERARVPENSRTQEPPYVR